MLELAAIKAAECGDLAAASNTRIKMPQSSPPVEAVADCRMGPVVRPSGRTGIESRSAYQLQAIPTALFAGF